MQGNGSNGGGADLVHVHVWRVRCWCGAEKTLGKARCPECKKEITHGKCDCGGERGRLAACIRRLACVLDRLPEEKT
jgi:hypothetical protein